MLPPLFQRPFYLALLCFAGGSLSALAMAPYNIWGVLLVGFGVLYVALDRAQTQKHAFIYGWLFGFGYFLFGLYWIGNALLVEGNPYKWAWPLAVCGLPALLAFFPAFGSLAIKRFLNLKTWHGYIGFAIAMVASEWIRGHIFTGFPWNLYGYTWADVLPVLQIVSLESVYSLTGLTIFWASIIGFWIVSNNKVQTFIISAFVLSSFAGVYSYGVWRLSGTEMTQSNLSVRIVQPNTPQAEKWERDKMPEHFKTALDLSRPTSSEEAAQSTIIIWPETALSPAYLNDPFIRRKITDMLSSYTGEAELITGALRYQSEGKAFYNSVVTIGKDGKSKNIYNKSHLVPFGEYIPFQKYIPLAPVAKFTGMKAGDGLQAFPTLENQTYSPIVCYEAIFPKNIIPKDKKPNFIINVTNDAWYGDSPGPYQHSTIARFRAVEEGIPLIRAANTGFSEVIDPYGRVAHKASLFEERGLFARVPFALNTPNAKTIKDNALAKRD